MGMRAAGVREIKNKLRECLRYVAQGETVLVTDHGRVVAQLAPPPLHAPPPLTDVGVRIRSDDRFARCRALDAVHACTALRLREWTGHADRLGTFDQKLAELAAELHLR